MKTATLVCSVIAAALLSAPAYAGDGSLGFASSGTTTVTVVIPPIQAGIAATEEGAVGLWTLEPGAAGLMVKIPDLVAAGESSSLDVFRANGNVFDVSLPTGSDFHLHSTFQTATNGLTRQSYVLTNEGMGHRGPLQVMIRGI